jgi:hypothetical protein
MISLYDFLCDLSCLLFVSIGPVYMVLWSEVMYEYSVCILFIVNLSIA